MTIYKSKGAPKRNCPQTSKCVYYIHTFYLASDFQRVKKKDYIIDFYVLEAQFKWSITLSFQFREKNFNFYT